MELSFIGGLHDNIPEDALLSRAGGSHKGRNIAVTPQEDKIQKHGLELELSASGGKRTPQACTTGGVDIAVQSVTEMAFFAQAAIPAIAASTL